MECPHRCASCLDELPRTARRFVVFVPEPARRDGLPYIEIDSLEFVPAGREEIVCEACVGWYHDGHMEVTADEVEAC